MIAVRQIRDLFHEQVSFNQETTLCGKSILKHIDYAKSLGYKIYLYYVGLESAALAKQRIAERVRRGGHGLPPEEVERRYTESLDHLRIVIPKCELAMIYDNTDSFKKIAEYRLGNEVWRTENIPVWYEKFMKTV